MAVCFNNGTSFTGSNASHVINFNGTSMCTVFDRNSNGIKFDRQCICFLYPNSSIIYFCGHSLDYLNCTNLYKWCTARGCWYFMESKVQSRLINWSVGSGGKTNYTSCVYYQHSYPEANWRYTLSCYCLSLYNASCVLVPACCGYSSVSLCRNMTYVCPRWISCGTYLGAGSTSNTWTVSISNAYPLCTRKAYAYGPNDSQNRYSGIPWTGCDGCRYIILAENMGSLGGWVTDSAMCGYVNCSWNWHVPSSYFRSRELVDPFNSRILRCMIYATDVSANLRSPYYNSLYAAFYNLRDYCSSCFRVGSAYTRAYLCRVCSCPIGNSYCGTYTTTGTWYGTHV